MVTFILNKIMIDYHNDSIVQKRVDECEEINLLTVSSQIKHKFILNLVDNISINPECFFRFDCPIQIHFNNKSFAVLFHC